MAAIRTVEEMFSQFLQKERAVLDKHEIKHGPTIGAMYEGLTRDALDRTLPSGADLRVVAGFVRGATGTLSKQIDCMLVTGEGERVPHTDSWIYDVQHVIAAIEVKKSLHGNDITDGYDNLASLMQIDRSRCAERPRLARHAFQTITGCAWPRDRSKLLAIDPQLDLLCHITTVEAATPLRILLGYHGFTSLDKLAIGVIDDLDERVGTKGAGPFTWPHLIANASGSIVKGHGMPWGVPLVDGWWHAMLRLDARPTYPLLELIWSRLNYMGHVDPIAFGDDLDMEVMRPLLSARFLDPSRGWEVEAIRPSKPARTQLASDQPATEGWQPVEFEDRDSWLITQLCNEGMVDVGALPAGGALAAHVAEALARLRGHGIVGPDPTRPSEWHLLTTKLQTVILPDGRFVGGENATGRLTRWVNRLHPTAPVR